MGLRQSSKRALLGTLLFAGAVVGGVPLSRAQMAEGCADLDWPVDTELALFAKADLAEVATGSALEAGKAEGFVLKLVPAASAQLPVAPAGKSKAEGSSLYAGFVTVEGGAGGGGVQVTLAEDGWIDVIQGGRPLVSTTHTGSKNCPGARKSVQFDVTAGPFVVQISGAPQASIKVSIRPVE
jgi:hypothetical protein